MGGGGRDTVLSSEQLWQAQLTRLPPSFTPLYLGHPQLLLQALQMSPQCSCLVLSRPPPSTWPTLSSCSRLCRCPLSAAVWSSSAPPLYLGHPQLLLQAL